MSGKAAATKERVLEAAEQVFAEKGFHETAMDEIVTVSGASKGSIYFHFPSKENLFLAVMEQLGRRLIQRVEREVAQVEAPAERLDVALETALRTLTRHKSLAKLLLAKGYSMGPGYAEKRQEVMGEFAALCERLGHQITEVTSPIDGARAARAFAAVWGIPGGDIDAHLARQSDHGASWIVRVGRWLRAHVWIEEAPR